MENEETTDIDIDSEKLKSSALDHVHPIHVQQSEWRDDVEFCDPSNYEVEVEVVFGDGDGDERDSVEAASKSSSDEEQQQEPPLPSSSSTTPPTTSSTTTPRTLTDVYPLSHQHLEIDERLEADFDVWHLGYFNSTQGTLSEDCLYCAHDEILLIEEDDEEDDHRQHLQREVKADNENNNQRTDGEKTRPTASNPSMQLNLPRQWVVVTLVIVLAVILAGSAAVIELVLLT